MTLVFSASVAGQLVPCGCSPDQRGGLPRAVAIVDKLRKEEPNLLFVDAGDLLFETAAPPPKQMMTQRQMKARVLAQGDQLLKAAARVVGQRDLALGPRFLTDTAYGVPLLDAGFAAPGLRASLLADAGGVKVGFFAAGFEPDPAAVIASRAKGLKEQGARLVVLLLHPRGDNAFTAAQALLPVARAAGVDLVVLGRRDDPATDGDRKDPGPPPLLAVEGHGQSLLRLDVHFGKGPLQLTPSAEDRDEEVKAIQARIDRFRAQIDEYPQRKSQLEAKIKELQEKQNALRSAPPEKPAQGSTWAQATFLPLAEKVGNDPAAQKLVDAYDQKVAEINLAEAKTQPAACPAPARGELAYVGSNACVECHQDAAEFWTQTRHAHAYETLVAVKKQFSLDCIRCHVTGWQQPGGVCRIDKTGVGEPGIKGSAVGRRDVQCEACHGPGSAHVDDPTAHIQNEVPASWCMRCHEPANSPKFDDRKYRPFIVGPGHGQPLAKGQKPKPKEGYPE
ncbi:MAG: multiheme c-type cytochrome [Myxococcales bacterium]